ncbi:MAG: FkbM family methyltransferase [Actinomycetota bacterium]
MGGAAKDLRKRARHSFPRYLKSVAVKVIRHRNNRGRRIRALLRASGWQLYKRLVRRPLRVRVYSTLALRCYPDSTVASKVIYFGDLYDPDEMKFIIDYLRPGDGFIDGGANIGTYSLLAASLVGPGGRVEAFEPHPVAAARLRENAALNDLDFVQVNEVALGEVAGIVGFTGSMDTANRVLTGAEWPTTRVDVPVATLDEWLDDAPFAMAKFDLEGSELAALRGFDHHLARSNPPVFQLEAREGLLARLGGSREALISLLSAHDYDLAVYDSDSGELAFKERVGPHVRDFLAIARPMRDMVIERLAHSLREPTSAIR